MTLFEMITEFVGIEAPSLMEIIFVSCAVLGGILFFIMMLLTLELMSPKEPFLASMGAEVPLDPSPQLGSNKVERSPQLEGEDNFQQH